MNKERINISEENKSITLNTSPVIMNKPFTNRRKAQKRIYCGKTERPKINIKNARAAARSIVPRIFTNTIRT